MTRNPLIDLGNIPIQSGTLHSVFERWASPQEKVLRLERDGQLIRLKRGLYVVSSEVSGRDVDLRLCANHIYGPSYVSLQWALRCYGMIPERVMMMTSVTTKHSRTFENALGTFYYRQVPHSYFPIGIREVEHDGIVCLMASPEKALCDTIIAAAYIPSQSVSALREYLEDDLRLDMDALRTLDIGIIEQCANEGLKTLTLRNLIKIIEQ